MKLRQALGWALLIVGLLYGIYKSRSLLDKIFDNGPSTLLFSLLFIIILLAIVRILRH